MRLDFVCNKMINEVKNIFYELTEQQTVIKFNECKVHLNSIDKYTNKGGIEFLLKLQHEMLSIDKIFLRYVQAELFWRNTDDIDEFYSKHHTLSLFNDVKFEDVQGRERCFSN